MNRREWLKVSALSAGALASGQAGATEAAPHGEVCERWQMVEQVLRAEAVPDPFSVTVEATFRRGSREVRVPGFFDGNGRFLLRFLPDEEGLWTWKTKSAVAALDARSGSLHVRGGRRRGPVGVRNTFHFGCADGSSFFPFGTTCYNLAHVDDVLQSEVLKTLAGTGFNKVRFCLLPKETGDSAQQHPLQPFAQNADGSFSTGVPEPRFFARIDRLIAALGAAGIEAEPILFHPYDKYGFNLLPMETLDRLLRYIVARYAAYPNVWWSIANEYDLVKMRTTADWDHFLKLVQQEDPYGHLRSIHHSKVIYDHAHPWVTHASLQEDDFAKAPGWLAAWNKPVIFDECKYEGNLWRRWGNLSGEEMTRRAWLAVVAGCYVTHGEVYEEENDKRLWSDAGPLRGSSPQRIAFLRRIVEESTMAGLHAFDSYYPSAGKEGELYLYYLDYHQPREYSFPLPETSRFRAELLDPWAMTVTPLPGTFSGRSRLALPRRPGLVVRFRSVHGGV